MPNKLISAISKGKRNEFTRVIREANDNGTLRSILTETNKHQESPLICAIKKGYTSMAQTMIKIGADINYVVPTTQKTPLMYAAELGNDTLVENLITYGVTLDLLDFVGQTAYDIAIENGYDEIAQMIATPESVTELHKLIDRMHNLYLLPPKKDTLTGKIHDLYLKKPDSILPPPEKLAKLNLSIMAKEIEEFKSDLKLSTKAENFVQQYIENHKSEGVTTPYVVFGLILNSAIALEDVQLVKDITDIMRSDFETNIVDIITCVDASGCSAISSTLYSGNQELLTLVGSLIQDLRSQLIEKTDCIPEDLRNLETVVRCPHFEGLDAETCINDFIKPVYSEESITKITALLGELY